VRGGIRSFYETVLPVTTYAVSGLGSAPDEYADA